MKNLQEKQFLRPIFRWKHNINMGLGGMGLNCLDLKICVNMRSMSSCIMGLSYPVYQYCACKYRR